MITMIVTEFVKRDLLRASKIMSYKGHKIRYTSLKISQHTMFAPSSVQIVSP